MAETYDVVIIGGGAAGFTAGIYAARDRYRTLIIERMAPGGQRLVMGRRQRWRRWTICARVGGMWVRSGVGQGCPGPGASVPGV